MILFETTLGDFKIEFFEKEAPLSVANFQKYIDGGFFDGTIFHRIVPGFVIQGGGFTEDMTQKKTEAPVKNEADNGLKNSRGTLSMARTNDINSATSQFFVNLKDNDFLDHSRGNFGYAVFARVTEGMNVVDKIAAVETGRKRGFDDVPVEAVITEGGHDWDTWSANLPPTLEFLGRYLGGATVATAGHGKARESVEPTRLATNCIGP